MRQISNITKYNTMKILTLILLCITSIVEGQSKFVLQDNYDGYIPFPPIPYEGSLKIYDAEAEKVNDLLAVSLKMEQLRTVLPDLSVESYLSKINSDGKVEYSSVSISANKEDYNVVYDIAKFTTVLLTNPDDACRIYGKVGVGIRIRADIKTRRKNLNVANLVGVGASASNNKLNGGISFQIFGIEGKDVVNLAPSSLTIDINSVNLALQAAATIKTRMYDEGINLSPRIFAVKKEGCDVPTANSKILQLMK